MSYPPLLLGRREVVAGAAAVALAATPLSRALAQQGAAETAQGTVYDADSSPRRGLPGVMVSNGADMVKTDAQGRWSLPVRPGDSLFVIKPAGWATPVDPATNLPRFTYIHMPDGTPDLGFRFPGIPPTGDLPDSIDFPLRAQQEPTRFEAILFTDPQPESLAEVDYIRDDVVSVVEKDGVAFGITHGDVLFDDLSYYPRYNHIVGSVGLTWYNCCGNHDMNLEAPDNVLSRETFKRTYGARYHAFQYDNVTFFILDNVDYLGTDPSKPYGYGKYRGFFGDRQLGFVRNVLANVPRDQLVVFSFHISLRTMAGTDPAVSTVDARLSSRQSPRTRTASAFAVIPTPMSIGISPRPTGSPPVRTTTMCSPRYREAGGAGRSTPAASRWRWKATAARTGSTFCRWTAQPTPPPWCRRTIRRADRCASCWTASCTPTGAR
jgi:hypothetical protein